MSFLNKDRNTLSAIQIQIQIQIQILLLWAVQLRTKEQGAWVGRHHKHELSAVCYPCGNFSDTPSLKLAKTKGSIRHAFTVCIHTENQKEESFYPFVLHEISILIELTLGHLRAAPAKLPN